MKKIGIITIIDRSNFGNRLQNYALSYYCNKKLNVETYTLENYDYLNNRKFIIARIIKHILRILYKKKKDKQETNRKNNFLIFDKKINYYKKKINAYTNLNNFDYLIVGSDQVWNPNFRRLRDVDVLKYAKRSKKISYSASFGVDTIPKEFEKRILNDISKFNYLSVREDTGKNIIQNFVDKEVDVLIDPTMLLTKDEWDMVSKEPKVRTDEKYILCYFLGELSLEKSKKIKKIADENQCKVINILDKNSDYYNCGPSEFLWLEKNAFLICTDSFHASVFAIIYDVSFIVFDREQQSMKKMNSRIDTLLSKFKLEDRKYNNKKITNNQLNHDYKETYEILEKEKEKSKKFLENALEIQ